MLDRLGGSAQRETRVTNTFSELTLIIARVIVDAALLELLFVFVAATATLAGVPTYISNLALNRGISIDWAHIYSIIACALPIIPLYISTWRVSIEIADDNWSPPRLALPGWVGPWMPGKSYRKVAKMLMVEESPPQIPLESVQQQPQLPVQEQLLTIEVKRNRSRYYLTFKDTPPPLVRRVATLAMRDKFNERAMVGKGAPFNSPDEWNKFRDKCIEAGLAQWKGRNRKSGIAITDEGKEFFKVLDEKMRNQ